jgi:hypothetical protein
MNKMRTPISVLLGLLVVLVGLTACKPKETELPFETVMKGDEELLGNFRATYESMDLMVATDPAEAQQIADTLLPERPGMRFEEIADVDYEKYLVIVAYFGAKPSNGFAITIERITQTEHDVNVVISTVESWGGDGGITHPIHVVKIRRADLSVTGHLSFSLWKGGEVILAREHFVP